MNRLNKIKVIFTFFLTIASFCTYSQSNVFKVTLDAGHGDHDFGAVYSGRIEKNIALAIVLKVGKILELNPNINVIYTRKTDVFIDLVERANIANRANSNIFVSIHCNANKNTAADGTETYVMGLSKVASNLEAAKKENSVITLEKDYKRKYDGFDPNSPEQMVGITLMQEEYLDNSISLASKIEDNFERLGKKIRQGGVKQAPFMVLHKAYMPRVLVETGFVSNPIEGNILNSEEGQDDIAKAIAEAILSYKREYFGSGTSEAVEAKPVKDTSTPKKVVQTPAPAAPKGTFFKVQLIASIKKTPLEPKNFKGLKNVTMIYENNIYKYFYQETSDYEAAKKYLEEAKDKGYGAAYLIATKDGEKISIQDAVK
ncbi:N-acetylmuramoyl-L-alanine amidase [Flavobacterium sp. CF108]|uniref:N-acetylmuramoyl-L-alanine amidase family protein n=1 Tax=unclassified Flavobacterium TaxID=196869 RepID=UPI0008CD9416|nr:MULTISPECIES: N-acetylmuramoyl-L-alanine amidase [unclassified Flavobacterium]SEO00251.1 N-acetylmuramoyl-L-alanine amidase [Flavobacterium sp. fv08]SHH35234.1 N-acetylmuramoyl-L-alanine amidase [Flavobacterium sp. CF108]